MTNKKEIKYVSDNSKLMSEWCCKKNTDVNPDQVTLGSHKKVWWKCSKGHEWQAIVKDRNNGNGCPFCSGRYPIVGENDRQTVNPTLATEWNFSGALSASCIPLPFFVFTCTTTHCSSSLAFLRARSTFFSSLPSTTPM